MTFRYAGSLSSSERLDHEASVRPAKHSFLPVGPSSHKVRWQGRVKVRVSFQTMAPYGAQADLENRSDRRACFRSSMKPGSRAPGTGTLWEPGLQDVSAVVSADESKGVR